MKSIKNSGIALIALLLIFASCRKEVINPPTTKDITLNLTGLTNLGSDFVYEGWIIVGGAPKSTGTFTVDDAGVMSKSSFSVAIEDVDAATKFVLTIEPKVDADPAPSATKYLAGDFAGNTASLGIGPVGDFSAASGEYILATPTDGMMTNETSGIWWVNPTGAAPVNGLVLPALSAGWKYEGWVVINGQPVSTGTFTNTSATDDSDTYSGPNSLPAPNGADGFFPGEDFLMNAPSGLSFPTDISGGKAVISVEPYPDTNPKPFSLKPLVGDIPAGGMDHVLYQMNQNLDFPSGSVMR